MKFIDFKKQYKYLYSPKPGIPEIVNVPLMQFMMVDGQGDPNNSKQFQEAITALYSTAYTLKFTRKKLAKLPDFSIGALEGLWWNPGGKKYEMGKKADWLWTLMVWLPDFITKADLEGIVSELKTKKPNPALAGICLESVKEGTAVQIMHIGPYTEEKPNIDKMTAYATKQGYSQSGKHHEIYSGDPRRAKPEKLRTILRHPIKKM